MLNRMGLARLVNPCFKITVLEISGRPRRPKSLPSSQFLVKSRGWLPEEKNKGQPSQK